jgi:hypothetical protein
VPGTAGCSVEGWRHAQSVQLPRVKPDHSHICMYMEDVCRAAERLMYLQCWFCDPDERAFYAYVYIMYIRTHAICITEHYIRMYVDAPAVDAAAPTGHYPDHSPTHLARFPYCVYPVRFIALSNCLPNVYMDSLPCFRVLLSYASRGLAVVPHNAHRSYRSSTISG